MKNDTKALLDKVSRFWADTNQTQTGNIIPTDLTVQTDQPVDHGEAPFPDPTQETFCTRVGGRLLGHECRDVDQGARRLVYLVRHYPIRPYLVHGGGSGIHIAAGAAWKEEHDALIREFSNLWWSAAGDAVIERYGDKLPMMTQDYPPRPYNPDEQPRQCSHEIV